MVVLVSVPGIFRDLLQNALIGAGYELSAIFDSLGEVENISQGECLIVYADHIDETTPGMFERFRRLFPDIPVELICATEIEEEATNRLGSLVNALMPADRPLDIVIGSLAVISEGYSVVNSRSPAETNSVQHYEKVEKPIPKSRPYKAVGLSDRELTVLKWIGNGKSNKEIARELEISDSTVKVHVRAILLKTGSKNRTQAAIWAAANL